MNLQCVEEITWILGNQAEFYHSIPPCFKRYNWKIAQNNESRFEMPEQSSDMVS